MARSRARVLWGIGFALVVLVCLGLTFAAYTERLPPQKWGAADKAVHFALAGALVFFLDGAFGRRDVKKVPLAAITVFVATGIEELLQSLSPVRESSFADYAADVAGVVCLVVLGRVLARRFRARSDEPA